jgi:hypothetical protein
MAEMDTGFQQVLQQRLRHVPRPWVVSATAFLSRPHSATLNTQSGIRRCVSEQRVQFSVVRGPIRMTDNG